MSTSLNEESGIEQPRPDIAATVRSSAAGKSVPGFEAGRKTKDILQAIVHMSPLPMVLTDPHKADDPLVYANRAFLRLTGYPEEEVLGRNCRFLQGEATDPAAILVLSNAVHDNTEAQVDLWNYRKDGTAFWNTMFIGPVFDREGNLLFHFGSQIDSTARRETEEARARAQRLDTLGSMAALIAHEFNNLMTVVVGNIEAVALDPLSARQAERLGRVGWAARAAGRLTQQMLSFAGRQSLQAELIDLNEVVKDFDRLLAQVAAHASFEVILCDMPLPTRLDVGQLELALINLVRNAADASPNGGHVTVTTRAVSGSNPAAFEIAVSDQGTGMPPDIAAHATEPFFTTKESGKGTGLGLSMVAGFCQQSGGTMQIETEPGKGTTIRLVFPKV